MYQSIKKIPAIHRIREEQKICYDDKFVRKLSEMINLIKMNDRKDDYASI